MDVSARILYLRRGSEKFSQLLKVLVSKWPPGTDIQSQLLLLHNYCGMMDSIDRENFLTPQKPTLSVHRLCYYKSRILGYHLNLFYLNLHFLHFDNIQGKNVQINIILLT